MYAYIVRRLTLGLFILWGVYTLTFFAVNLAPGDPFQRLENPKMQKEDIERLRAKWGYDQPVGKRYFIQLRKTFWADPEILNYEAGGLAFEVFAPPKTEGNFVRARVQVPPDELVLKPDQRSEIDYGAAEVRLHRAADGSYSSQPIYRGVYSIGSARLRVGQDEARLVTAGLTLEVRDGTLSATPTLAEPPDEVQLERDGQAPLILTRDERGNYGPLLAEPDRYRVFGVDLLVPDEQLDDGGLTFDLGTSVLNKQPVVSYLARPLVNTIILATAALLLDYAIGIFIGVVSAVRQNTRLDHVITVGALFVYSMPGFWFALMLMLLFAVKLRWLPAEGMHDVGASGLWDLLEHMVLPSAVLGIASAAATARFQRSALLEVMGQDYIRTARAKGLDERTVIWKHAMRNALIPVITLFGLSLPFLVSGAVITEQIFSWPGMGREAIKAIYGRDVFVITGITLISTSMVVLGNLVADILYAVVDPRVRLE